MYKKYFPLLLLIIPQILISCKKFVEVQNPINRISNTAAFLDDNTASATINGLYLRFSSNIESFGSAALAIYPGLSADEIVNNRPSNTYDPFYQNSISISDRIIANDLWRMAYATIYHANACIEGLVSNEKLTATIQKQLLGEAKFIRSFCYFYLTNLFGDIPLILTTDYRVNSSLPRTSNQEIIQHLVSDLTESVNLMSPEYPSAFRSRANSYVAKALLARVFLYKDEWANAEALSSEVIASGAYRLETNLANVFINSSSETIWQVSPSIPNFNSFEGYLFIPSSKNVIPSFSLTPQLLESFETGDTRRNVWIDSNIVDNVIYHFPAKYKIKFQAAVNEYPVYLRLAEQYLIRAEAKAKQNKLEEAKVDLNIVRERVGLPTVNATSQQEILLLIEKERRIELFTELGHRWFDLKRTKRADVVLSYKPNWTPAAALYPIPLLEINRNPFLTQNTGY